MYINEIHCYIHNISLRHHEEGSYLISLTPDSVIINHSSSLTVYHMLQLWEIHSSYIKSEVIN